LREETVSKRKKPFKLPEYPYIPAGPAVIVMEVPQRERQTESGLVIPGKAATTWRDAWVIAVPPGFKTRGGIELKRGMVIQYWFGHGEEIVVGGKVCRRVDTAALGDIRTKDWEE
jgi:co-chaperonin GroES (HSP10)